MAFVLPDVRVRYARKSYQRTATRADDSLDDIIPNAVVKEVYRMIPGPKARPEGEPITDLLHNGWNPLNGVADP